jgi:hypothetical protein
MCVIYLLRIRSRHGFDWAKWFLLQTAIQYRISVETEQISKSRRNSAPINAYLTWMNRTLSLPNSEHNLKSVNECICTFISCLFLGGKYFKHMLCWHIIRQQGVKVNRSKPLQDFLDFSLILASKQKRWKWKGHRCCLRKAITLDKISSASLLYIFQFFFIVKSFLK